jgi:hypothetical protein
MFCSPGYDFIVGYLELTERNYLEIGVFNGDSIGLLAKRYPNKKIFAVDPFIEDGNTSHTTMVSQGQPMPTQRENTYNNIKDLDNIELHEVTSIEFGKMCTEDMIKKMDIGCILIDGSHHYEDVIADAHLAMQLIGDDIGAIVFDDVNLPGVNRAYKEWLAIYSDKISQTKDLFNNAIIAHLINSEIKE